MSELVHCRACRYWGAEVGYTLKAGAGTVESRFGSCRRGPPPGGIPLALKPVRGAELKVQRGQWRFTEASESCGQGERR